MIEGDVVRQQHLTDEAEGRADPEPVGRDRVERGDVGRAGRAAERLGGAEVGADVGRLISLANSSWSADHPCRFIPAGRQPFGRGRRGSWRCCRSRGRRRPRSSSTRCGGRCGWCRRTPTRSRGRPGGGAIRPAAMAPTTIATRAAAVVPAPAGAGSPARRTAAVSSTRQRWESTTADSAVGWATAERANGADPGGCEARRWPSGAAAGSREAAAPSAAGSAANAARSSTGRRVSFGIHQLLRNVRTCSRSPGATLPSIATSVTDERLHGGALVRYHRY